LFEEACRIAVEDGGFRMAWIGLADPTSRRVLPAAHAGVTNDYLERLDIVLGDDARGRGPTGSAVRAGKHMACNDIENDPHMTPWREDALRNGYRSSATFPLKVLGEVRGAFSLYAAETDFFDDEEVKLLDELAMDIGFAMEFAQKEAVRKRTEGGLQESEARYRRLFESAKDGILILDAENGMIVDVNPFLVELLGFPYEAFLGKKVWELGFFKDIVANQDKFVELQQKGYVRYEDLPLETVDGRRIQVEFVSNVYLVNDQKVIQCNIRDITSRVRAEDRRERREAAGRSQGIHPGKAGHQLLPADQERHDKVHNRAARESF